MSRVNVIGPTGGGCVRHGERSGRGSSWCCETKYLATGTTHVSRETRLRTGLCGLARGKAGGGRGWGITRGGCPARSSKLQTESFPDHRPGSPSECVRNGSAPEGSHSAYRVARRAEDSSVSRTGRTCARCRRATVVSRETSLSLFNTRAVGRAAQAGISTAPVRAILVIVGEDSCASLEWIGSRRTDPLPYVARAVTGSQPMRGGTSPLEAAAFIN